MQVAHLRYLFDLPDVRARSDHPDCSDYNLADYLNLAELTGIAVAAQISPFGINYSGFNTRQNSNCLPDFRRPRSSPTLPPAQ